jgi:hypothetical protein
MTPCIMELTPIKVPGKHKRDGTKAAIAARKALVSVCFTAGSRGSDHYSRINLEDALCSHFICLKKLKRPKSSAQDLRKQRKGL